VLRRLLIGGNESDSIRQTAVRLDPNDLIKQREGNPLLRDQDLEVILHPSMRTTLRASTLVLLTALLLSCATKGFVRTEVGQVADRVATIGASIEQTQERIRQAEGRLSEMDQRAAAALDAARRAQQLAEQRNATIKEQELVLAEKTRLVEQALANARIAAGAVSDLQQELHERRAAAALAAANTARPLPSYDPASAVNVFGALDHYKQQFAQGEVKLTAPEQMTVSRPDDVTLIAAGQGTLAQLEKVLTPEAGTQSVAKPTRLSNYMRAELTGADFTIERIGSAEQTGVIADGATWHWKVTPKKEGQLTLTATLTAILRIDDEDRTRDERVLKQDIVVLAVPQTWRDVAKGWWDSYGPPAGYVWTTVITGACTALATYLVGWWRRRKKPTRQSTFE
jgi:hypothetical protein